MGVKVLKTSCVENIVSKDCNSQAEKEGTVGPLVPWTVAGRPVDGRRTAGGRSSAAPVSSVSSAAPKKKPFDEGGPVWPPRSNVTNDRLRGRGGGAPPPQKISKKKKKKKKKK